MLLNQQVTKNNTPHPLEILLGLNSDTRGKREIQNANNTGTNNVVLFEGELKKELNIKLMSPTIGRRLCPDNGNNGSEADTTINNIEPTNSTFALCVI